MGNSDWTIPAPQVRDSRSQIGRHAETAVQFKISNLEPEVQESSNLRFLILPFCQRE
jgi:hypothetical protein